MMRIAALVLLSALSVGIHAVTAQETFTTSTSCHNLLSNFEGKGMLDRILTEAFRRIGFKVEIVYTPTAQSLPDVNAGIMDGEIKRIAGMEIQFPNLRRISEPDMSMDFVAFSSRPMAIAGWSSLRGLDVALYDRLTGYAVLKDLGYASITHAEPPPAKRDMFLYVRKKHEALMQRIAGSLRAMEPDGSYDAVKAEVLKAYDLSTR